MSDYVVRTTSKRSRTAFGRLASWTKGYLRCSAIVCVCCAYDVRFIGTGSNGFRKVLNAGVSLTAVLFKLLKDPRISAMGAHLRHWSADELPQLFNMVLGHVFLVGPGPPLPDEAARYAKHVRRRLLVKPEVTGLRRVSGRSDLSWNESVRLDLRYAENWLFAWTCRSCGKPSLRSSVGPGLT